MAATPSLANPPFENPRIFLPFLAETHLTVPILIHLLSSPIGACGSSIHQSSFLLSIVLQKLKGY
jgi:hypothetical protein